MRLASSVLASLAVVLSVALLPARPLAAQGSSATLTGRVTDAASGNPLSGARVSLIGTAAVATTRGDGTYRLGVRPGTYELRVTMIGYGAERRPVTVAAGQTTTEDVRLTSSPVELQEVAVVGTRASERTVTEAPVAIDVLTAAEIRATGRTETAQIIQSLAPSVNFPRSTVTDGTDHSRPATLRGLAPDQTLVLINGKRRHTSALINVNGTIGRGSGMVDLNAIPATSIDRIEILRDGAAAQYGSDAIAGVINIVLKQGAENEILATLGQHYRGDGETIQLGTNYGVPIGGGSLQLSAEFRDHGFTNRSEPDFRQQYFAGDPREAQLTPEQRINHRQGDADTRDIGGFLNYANPIGESGAEIYAFGGVSFRRGEAAGFWRRANDDRTVRALHPNGFLPLIATRINDYSGVTGVRGAAIGWNWDLSANYGRNSFEFNVENSNNASMGAASPTEFYAGTLAFQQLTFNLDVARPFEIGFASPLNVAVGAEFRRDGYDITAGEPASYQHGGQTVLDGPGAGNFAAPGAQVFPGFQPGDEADASRHNVAAYLDLESRLTPMILLNVAGRVEDYNDFGSTTDGKVALRIEPTPGIALRGSASTGFRAPALAQSFLSATATNFLNGQPFENRTFPVNTGVAQALGAQPLKPEQSVNLAAGVALTPVRNLTLTADYYRITIDDRIVLSGNFTGTAIRDYLTAQGFAGVAGARFFTNAIDTKTNGIEVVANWAVPVSTLGTFRFTGGYSWNENEVTRVASTPPALSAFQETLFDRVERSRIEVGQPKDNLLLSGSFTAGPASLSLRTKRYGELQEFGTAADGSLDYTQTPKWITDFSVGYRFAQRVDLTVGADNLFDVYPDRRTLGNATTAGINNFGIFPYNGISPFGFNGVYWYTKVQARF